MLARSYAAARLKSRVARSFAAFAGLKTWLLAAVVLLASMPAVRAEGEKPVLPPPKDVALRTADDVTLASTYYASLLGKDAVPVVLLHSNRGNRGDFESLALKLQHEGHAVVAVDLRGHGDSNSNRERAGELRVEEYEAMVTADMEAVKKFLLARNNAGELNIEKLCVLGVEMGATIALVWAAQDWNWPALSTGKQGQDVKALVLISPEWSYKGLRINDAVNQPNVRSDVSMLIVAGSGSSKILQEAKRLNSAIEKYRAPALGEVPGTHQTTLWLRTPRTSLQGTRLLNERSLDVDRMILQFIDVRLTKQQFPWTERRDPFARAN